jgi:hypothetical protein
MWRNDDSASEEVVQALFYYLRWSKKSDALWAKQIPDWMFYLPDTYYIKAEIFNCMADSLFVFEKTYFIRVQ